nr:peptidoglycan bridge formation glycyltransferase FemA/FemB family protein [Candidatus Woesebacteria bacterium]
IWNHLKDGVAHILIASYEDEPLAAYELFYFNNVLYYPYGGSSDKNRNLMASNLLMWEAIRFGKKLGATQFDMWGSMPPDYDRSSEWAGFTRFKEGYGTDFVEFIGSYDLVIEPVIYPLYNLIYKVRDTLLRARLL